MRNNKWLQIPLMLDAKKVQHGDLFSKHFNGVIFRGEMFQEFSAFFQSNRGFCVDVRLYSIQLICTNEEISLILFFFEKHY